MQLCSCLICTVELSVSVGCLCCDSKGHVEKNNRIFSSEGENFHVIVHTNFLCVVHMPSILSYI